MKKRDVFVNLLFAVVFLGSCDEEKFWQDEMNKLVERVTALENEKNEKNEQKTPLSGEEKENSTDTEKLNPTAPPNGFYNGKHEYVDLGLPSGNLWATCNIGANSPEEYGNYYAWGFTGKFESIFDFEKIKIKESISYNEKMEKYENKTELEKEDDPAYVEWGGKWRTPSEADFIELFNECDYKKILGKRNGLKFTAHNGNTLFFPWAGYYSRIYWNDGVSYWSRNLKKTETGHLILYKRPIVMFFNNMSSAVDWLDNEYLLGLPVRPVFNNN